MTNQLNHFDVTVANDVTSLSCKTWIIDSMLYEGSTFTFNEAMQTMVSYLTKNKKKRPSLIAFWNKDRISFKAISTGAIFDLN